MLKHIYELKNELREKVWTQKDLPQEVGIKLPTLKKSNDNSNSSQIKLPKLKKIKTEGASV